MPRAPKKCGRDGCDERVVGVTYCAEHQAAIVSARPSRHVRGYGSRHDGRVRLLRRASSASSRPCHLCHRSIDYTLRAPHPQSFAAHHLTRDRNGPLVPTHKVCNERAGQPEPMGATTLPWGT